MYIQKLYTPKTMSEMYEAALALCIARTIVKGTNLLELYLLSFGWN